MVYQKVRNTDRGLICGRRNGAEGPIARQWVVNVVAGEIGTTGLRAAVAASDGDVKWKSTASNYTDARTHRH